MKRGTLSVLFGVHQFLWHPITVLRAWRHLYGRWPKWHWIIAILCHDLGYWGKPNMDGPEGQTHPEAGAELASDVVYRIGRIIYCLRKNPEECAGLMAESAYQLSIGHSTHYSKLYRCGEV